jgi:hypothetical protein
MRDIVEAGVIPSLVKLVAQNQLRANRTLLLHALADHDDYCAHFLSANLLSIFIDSLKSDPSLFPTYKVLCRKLSLKASSNQLIPFLCFLSTQLPNEVSFLNDDPDDYDDRDDDDDYSCHNPYHRHHSHRHHYSDDEDYHSDFDFYSEDNCWDCESRREKVPESPLSEFLVDIIVDNCSVGTLVHLVTSSNLVHEILFALATNQGNKRYLGNLSKVLSHLFLRDPPLIPVNDALLSSWKHFLTQIYPDKLKMFDIGPILLKIITTSPDLNSIVESGLLSAMFSRMAPQCHDDFIGWLLDLLDLALCQIPGIGQERREEVVLLLDHLVDLGMLSSLFDSLILKNLDNRNVPGLSVTHSRRSRSEQDVLRGLRMVIGFDQRYESQLRRAPLMTLMQSVFEEGGGSDNDEVKVELS